VNFFVGYLRKIGLERKNDDIAYGNVRKYKKRKFVHKILEE